MRKMVIYITIFMSVILSQFIFINTVKAATVTGASGRVYTNLQNDRVVIYSNSTIASTTPYNNFRVLYTPYNVLCSYNNSNYIYAYDNISQCNEYGVNKRMTRYSVANSSYSSYNDSSNVLYFTIGSYPFNNDYSVAYNYIDYSYLDIVDNNGNIIYCGNVETNCITLPSYLTGYKKITLPGNSYNDVRYYALSGLSSGSVFVPYDYVLQYGGGLQYQNSEGITDWSSAVEDYYVMDDEQYVRYDFNINNYPNAEFVFYTKYFYFEGSNFPSVDIYVPDDTYTSPVVVSENNQGGNDFTFSWEDQEGNVTSSTQETIPVNYNPLLPSFLQEFSSDTFGLTSIITSPLTLISSITSSTCSSIFIPMPFSNNNLVLPCMSDFYRSFLGNWFGTYQFVTFGIISYWVIVRIFNLIKDFKNPEHDEVEVLDL